MKIVKNSVLFLMLSPALFLAQSLKSPDGNFEMIFQLKNGVPYYHLNYKGKTVIEDSRLGLRLLKDNTIAFDNVNKLPDGKNLNSDFEKIAESRDSKNENWAPVLGEKKYYTNHYNELSVTLNQPNEDRKIIVKFRLFNDGLGFRYEFPQQKNLNYFVVKEEDTEFNFPYDLKSWWVPADYDTQEYKPTTSLVSQISTKWESSFDSNASQTLVKNAVQSPLMLKKEVSGKEKPLYINLAEAARGTEFEAMGGNNPDHTTILPFTRFMGGPMDYTPGIFQTQYNYYDANSKNFANTTLAKQLGLYVVMYSPLQMACDLPENYERHLDAFQFIKDVAVDWDDTKILSAEPGDYIHTARKAKGSENWFVGGVTDENARDFTVDFSFLEKGKKYEATIYEDGKNADYEKNPQAYHIYKKVVTNGSKIKVHLARSGGYAISLKPIK